MTELASYAAHSSQTRGRAHPEASAHPRSEFQRDRDRIIHSTGFRRLEYKTQVFVNHEGDLFRTRLTHSLEVAQIGRTIARLLNLNEDLVEAIARLRQGIAGGRTKNATGTGAPLTSTGTKAGRVMVAASTAVIMTPLAGILFLLTADHN